MRQRSRKASPMGLMQSTTCRLATTRERKKAYSSSPVSPAPAAFAGARTSSHSAPSSSLLNRLGTSPEVRMLLMSSRNVSTTICVSSNRNTVGLFPTPACRYRFFRSSWNSVPR